MLNYEVTQEEISKWYGRIKSTTNNTKMRSFIFRMLNGIMYNNTQLKSFGYTETDNCTFCHEPEQTPEHMFLYCAKVKAIREKLERKMNLTFSHRERMFGVDCPAKNYVIFF